MSKHRSGSGSRYEMESMYRLKRKATTLEQAVRMARKAYGSMAGKQAAEFNGSNYEVVFTDPRTDEFTDAEIEEITVAGMAAGHIKREPGARDRVNAMSLVDNPSDISMNEAFAPAVRAKADEIRKRKTASPDPVAAWEAHKAHCGGCRNGRTNECGEGRRLIVAANTPNPSGPLHATSDGPFVPVNPSATPLPSPSLASLLAQVEDLRRGEHYELCGIYGNETPLDCDCGVVDTNARVDALSVSLRAAFGAKEGT